MIYNNFIYEKKDHIVVLSFNRPKSLNVLNMETLYELEKVINDISNDPDARVIIFTGSGKAFIAGADIAEMEQLTPGEANKYSMFGSELFRKLVQLNKITIAAVNGYCFGGGNEFSLHCDLRYASKSALFGQPEVGLGIIPGFSGTQALPRLVGMTKAKELLFTGKTISATEAYHIGMINNVFEDDVFFDEVLKIAGIIAKNSFQAVIHCKRSIHEGYQKPYHEAIIVEANQFGKCFESPEQKEGMRAFIEKRTPNYRK